MAPAMVSTLETSPPTWGKLSRFNAGLDKRRNIPTYVGKTVGEEFIEVHFWKHPHLRGENAGETVTAAAARETSPPTWGKLPKPAAAGPTSSNIPTYVGKTSGIGSSSGSSAGNIPTYVGKTRDHGASGAGRQKHPHLRGENARFCLDCHYGYYILLKSKFLALSLRQGCAIFAYHPSLGIDLRLAEALRDVPNDCGGRVIKGRLLPN